MAPKSRALSFPPDPRRTVPTKKARTLRQLRYPTPERTPSPPVRRVSARALQVEQPLLRRLRQQPRVSIPLEPLEDLTVTTLPEYWQDQDSDATTSDDEADARSSKITRQLVAKLSRREKMMDSADTRGQSFLEWSAV